MGRLQRSQTCIGFRIQEHHNQVITILLICWWLELVAKYAAYLSLRFNAWYYTHYWIESFNASRENKTMLQSLIQYLSYPPHLQNLDYNGCVRFQSPVFKLPFWFVVSLLHDAKQNGTTQDGMTEAVYTGLKKNEMKSYPFSCQKISTPSSTKYRAATKSYSTSFYIILAEHFNSCFNHWQTCFINLIPR